MSFRDASANGDANSVVPADGGLEPAEADGGLPPGACTGINQVVTGQYHACAVGDDGALWCWGANGYGQLGDGTTDDKATPTLVSALGSDVIQVAAGADFSCALKRDGTVWCWGNDHGQLGHGTYSLAPVPTPRPVWGLGSGVVQVSAAGYHACARKQDGTLWCWGLGFSGDGGAWTVHGTPEKVTPLGNAVASVSVGWAYACAVKTDGSLWCWGKNGSSQLGDGTSTESAVPLEITPLGHAVVRVFAGDFAACAVKSDGALWCWGGMGQNLAPYQVDGLGAKVVSASVGYDYTCAITTGGKLLCWGLNSLAQIGNGGDVDAPTPGGAAVLSEAREVSAGYFFTCAVQSTGTLRCWGRNNYGQLGVGTTAIRESPVPVADLGTGATQLATGIEFFCASKNDGSAWCWGQEPLARFRGTGLDASLRPVRISVLPWPATRLGGGWRYACALLSDGGVWCWGRFNGRPGSSIPLRIPGLPSGIADLAVGGEDACILATDGSVWCWPTQGGGSIGDGGVGPQAPAQMATLGTSVTQISKESGMHACARKNDGSLWCWGFNGWGKLGDGTTTDSDLPVAVAKLGPHAQQVSAGSGDHTCACLDDGTVWCWGSNLYGQLGDGTINQSPVPVQVQGLASAVQVSTGGSHSCALTSDGGVWCWGDNSAGQLGIGTGGQRARSLTPVRVTSAGSSAVEIHTGWQATCIRNQDGSIWCWGSREYGQMGDGDAGLGLSPAPVVGCR